MTAQPADKLGRRPRILIAGIGNIFLGDDAFGVEMVRQLSQRALPENVRLRDFGIRGLDLAYTLLDSADDVTILVDACKRGEEPGSLFVIEPDLANSRQVEAGLPALDPHAMDPVNVLRLVKSMGGELRRILVVGCEPVSVEPLEDALGLSAAVRAAVPEAVTLIESLIERLLSAEGSGAGRSEQDSVAARRCKEV